MQSASQEQGMLVAQPRPQDNSINICFSTSNAIVSRIIRWATKSTVSHALITFYSPSFRKVMVMEAVGKGYQMLPWKKWRSHNKLVARYSLKSDTVPIEAQCAALEEMADELGNAYDVRGLFGFISLLWRRGVTRVKNRGQDPNRLFCSEAVALFLQRAKLEGFDAPGDWSPARLLEHVGRRPELFALEEEN